MIRPRFTLAGLLLAGSFACASVDETLDALHDAGKDLQSLSADVQLQDRDTGTGDDTIHLGRIIMQRTADETRALISIDKKKVDGRTTDERRDVLLEGPKLIDRDYKNKKQTTRLIHKPGEKVDLFKLGQGPFPLPVGQTKVDVKRQFDVSEVSPGKVKLLPKAGTDLAKKFKSITVVLDPTTHFPLTIETLDPNETTITTATLSNVKINAKLESEPFALPAIDSSWNDVPG